MMQYNITQRNTCSSSNVYTNESLIISAYWSSGVAYILTIVMWLCRAASHRNIIYLTSSQVVFGHSLFDDKRNTIRSTRYSVVVVCNAGAKEALPLMLDRMR
jgi:hypothetical protein